MAMEKFHWKMEDGREIVLPVLGKVAKAGWLRDNMDLLDKIGVWTFVDEFADEKNTELIRDLSMDEFNDFGVAWQQNKPNLGK